MTGRGRGWTTVLGTFSLVVCVASIAAGDASVAAKSPLPSPPVIADTVPPRVTINQASFQADPAKGSLIYFTVRFSERVTGFTAGDVSLAGSTAPGDLTTVMSGSGASYTVWIGGMTGPGKVVASIPAGVARDAANNSSLASTSTDNTVTYKPAGPTVTINQASGQSDPTNTTPIRFDVSFSAAVTGFDASDVNLSGSTVGGSLAVQVSGSGASYSVAVSGMAGTGTLVATIPAGAARDAGNNNSFASTSVDNAVAFDNAAPSVSINQSAGQIDPALTSPVLFTVIFSEPVTGFSASDVSFAGSTAGGILAASVTGAGQSYTVSVSGMTSSGTVMVSIPAGAATDGVGNASTASTSTDRTVTYSSTLTVTINQAQTQTDPTNIGPVVFNVGFSTPVTGFDGSDVSFAGSTVGGTLLASVSGSGANYTVSVSGMSGAGTVVASIPGGAAVDAGNKSNVASTSTDHTVTFDNAPPTVTINKASSQNDPTGASPIVFTVTFSEPVTGFTSADVSLAGSTAGGPLVATVTGSGASYSVAVSGMTVPGNVVASVPAGVAQDQTGNINEASTSIDNVVASDSVAPTVTIEQASSQSDPAGTSPVLFTVTFSEPVSGFAGSDVSLIGSTAGGSLTASVTGSGANYSVAVTGMTSPGNVVATIPSAAAQDTAGNSNQLSTSTDNVVRFDNTAPTVTINQAGNQSDPTSASAILFTVTFSEAVAGFGADDVLLSGSTVGGTLVANVTGSGATYAVTITGMSGSGSVVARIAAGAATDSAGNSSAASTSSDNVVTYLPTGPTVTINQASLQPDPTNVTPIGFTVVFSTPVTGFDGSDISFAGSTVSGSLIASVSGSGANYAVTVSGMTGAGMVVTSIAAGAAIDGANNPNQASTSIDNHVGFDNVAPTVTVNQSVSQSDPTAASPISFNVSFSEPVTGFNATDVSFAGSTANGQLSASVSGSSSSYTILVTGMTASGAVVITIPAGAAIDAAGNPSAASTSSDNSVTFDNVGPTVTINQASSQSDPTGASPIVFAVTFSEAVAGFTPGDVSFGGSTVAGTLSSSVQGSGASYTVSVTGMIGSGTLIVSVPAGAATDAAGNASSASTSVDNAVSFVPLGPTVTINQMPGPAGRSGQPDPTNASQIAFSVLFSAPVTGFDGSDIRFTGSTVGGVLVATVSGSGASYTVMVTGMTGNGTVVASIAADVAVDSAGAGNRASTSTDNSVTFDTTPPSVTIDQAAGQLDPTNSSPIRFAVTFSEPVVGFTSTDVSLGGSTAGGTLAAAVSGSGASYTISVTGMTSAGTVNVSIPAAAAKDAAGNNSLASTSIDTVVTYGVTGPSVTINQAAGQADPTNTSAIQFTVVFSAPVTGFTAADVDLTSHSTLTGLVANVTGSGANYTVTVTGMNGSGVVIPNIQAGAATDTGGNASLPSSSSDNVVTFDNVAPTVTINQAGSQVDPTNTSPVVFNVVFSEPVTGFATGDVLTTGSTVSGTLVASISGSGATYTVSVTGMTASGTVVVSIPAAAATDAAGNPTAGSTSIDNTVAFNNVSPTVTINRASGQADPTNTSPILFSVIFSTAVTGFTASDISLAGSTAPGTLVASVTGAGASYTASVSGMTAAGTVIATIPAGAATDTIGNLNSASTSTDNVVDFDNVVPTVTINQAAGQTDPTNGSPILFSVLFSEPVIGFAGGDVSFAGSTVGGTLTANVSGSGANYTVSVTGMNGSGTVVASIPAGSVTDPAINPNQASTSTDGTVTYNALAPTVVINQAVTQNDPANAAPIVYAVLFSAPVTGFTGTDLSFAGSTAGGTLVANVTGSGASYTVSVSGMTSSGTVVVSIPAGVAQDGVGNPNQASTSADNSITFDNVAPTATINQAAGQGDPTNVSPIAFTVTFSEPVTGFTGGDVSFAGSTAGGALAANVSGSGANYTLLVSGMTSPGAVIASVVAGAANDVAGNPSAASTSTDSSVTYNATGPSVTINQAAGQADPTNTSPIQFSVGFSAAVTGFTASDISFAGSTIAGLIATVNGSGADYTVSVTGMTGTGSVVASIPAGAATDSLGNSSAASASSDNTVTFDNVAPTVSINQAPGQADPTNASPIQFTVVFSEPVTGFTSSDVSLNGSTVGGTLVASVSGSGASYTVSVTGMTGAGTVVASVPAGAANDLAGNSSATSTSRDNRVSYNAVAPTVTIDQAGGQSDPTSTLPIQFTVVFSVPVTGFTASDLSFTGSTAPGIQVNVTGSGTTYIASVTGLTGSGTIVANIPSGAAVDTAGNTSQGSTSTDNTVIYDIAGPRVIGVSPSGNVTGPIDRLTLSFNEPILSSSFTLADVVSLTGPGGAIAPTLIDVLNTQAFEIVFPSQTSGTFSLVIGPDIRDPADNQMDQNANAINGEATADRFTTSFTIVGNSSLLSVSPGSGQQGQTSLDVVVDAQFSHFVNGVTTAGFTGTGISVNSVTVTSATSATLNIDISPIATTDQRSLTLTTNTELVSSSAAGTFFQITPSAATIASVNPNQGKQGDTIGAVTITGFTTHFANGSTTVSFGPGIAVNSVLVNSPTSLTASITIQASAGVGARAVTVSTAGEIATAPNGFTVNAGDPAITSVSPASARQGDTLNVTLDAVFTHFDSNTQPDFGAGITINSITPTTATSATVNITIEDDAAPIVRTVFMRTGSEEAKKVSAFTVLGGLARLASITPVAGMQGTSGTLVVTGRFTHFAQGSTSVSMGSGITMGTATVNGPALLSVPFTIEEGAAPGLRDVSVSSPGESVTLSNAFSVIPSPPGVSVIDPNAGQRGMTLNVSITGHFTTWQNGVTHVSYGAGITVNSNVVSSPTQITTNITIDPNATLGPRNLIVTTNTEELTVFGGFTVNDVDVTAPSLLTVSPASGSVDVPLNVVATVEVSEPLDRGSVTQSSTLLYDAFINQFVPADVSLDVTGRIITVHPTQLLAVSRNYTLYIGWYAILRDVAGNQFGGTYASFVTGFATDTTGPAAVLVNPPNGETGVALNTNVAVQFDRQINAAARAAGLQILKAGVPVAGTFTFADQLHRINFSPAVPWDPNTTYTIALSSGLIDLAGNSLTNPGNRTFTTGTSTDTTSPTLVSYSPSHLDTNVGLHPTIRIAFSEPVNSMELNSSTFYLYNNHTGVFVPTTMTVAPDRMSVTLTPVGNLSPYTQYYFYISAFADVAGNYGNGVSAYFTTAAAADATAPAVIAASPAAGATDVPVNALVQVTMSEAMDATSISDATLQLTPAAAGSVSLLPDRRTIKLTLAANLAPSTAYTLQASGARDTSGNVMTPFSSSFTTSALSTADTTAPTVLSFSPVNGATNVPLNTAISMTLSEPIDRTHVGPNSMGVYVGNTLRVDGTYATSADGTVVTFTPSTPLQTSSQIYLYTNLDSSITDLANNPLQYTFSAFVTAAAPADTTAPTVVSVTPVDGSSDVGPLATVTLTFSESLNGAVNGYTTFGLFAGGVPQSVSISRSADNRMVFLSGTWPLNTVMTVVATGDNTDLAGNHLAPFSSTFRTSATFDPSRPSVITQLPTGSGVNRAAPITLYVNKALNPATVANALYVSQNGVLVDGTIRTSGGGTAINFTPAAPFAPDAVIQVFLTSAALDTFGNAMVPYSGSFTMAPDPAANAPVIVRTSPSFASSDNPLNSIIDIEFSEPLNPSTVTMPANFGVYLFGGGTAIPGTLSLINGDRTIHFVPTSPLQAGAYYYVYLQNGLRDTQGVAFAGTNYYFYVGGLSDSTPPAVLAIAPPNGSVGVGLNASIRVTFSEPISALSVTPESITVSTAAGPVPVTFTLGANNTSLRIVPQNPLPSNALMTVSIGGYDIAGHNLPVVQSQFTTGTAADTVAPTVISASWTPNQTGIPVNSVFEVVLSEAMDVPTVLAQQNFFLYDGHFGGYVAGSLAAHADARTFTFTPAAPLAVNHPYSVALTSALDLAGNVMSTFSSSFSTSYVTDTTPPSVIGVNPLDGATGVPRNAKIRVLFNEPISVDSLPDIKLLRNGSPVPVSSVLTNANRLATLTATGLLVSNAVYSLSIQVRDASGNTQAAPIVSTFTAGNDVDLTPPTIIGTSPLYGQVGVPLNVVFRVVFSEPIDPLTIDDTNFYLYNAFGQPLVPTTIEFASDLRSATLTPTQPLLPGSQYVGGVFGYSDPAGNPGQGTGISFLTGDSVDLTAPRVAAVTPADGTNNVPVNARIRVVMNEPVDNTSVANTSIQLSPATAGTVALDDDHRTLTFTPAGPLTASTSYVVTVSGLRDLVARTMTSFTSGFATSATSTADTTAPTIVSMTPVSGAAGVAVNSSIVMVASEPITPTTVGPTTMPVYVLVPSAGGYVQVAGTYSVDSTNTIVTFTPASPYPANTTVAWYTNYTSQITDFAGNPLQYLTPQFTTGSAADTTAPTLVSVTPTNAATGLGPYSAITLTFSESVSPATVDGTTLALFAGTARVTNFSVIRSIDNRMVTLSVALAADTTYTIAGTSDIKDLSGNSFAGFSSSFTTAPFDVSRPSIITQRPTGSGAQPTTSITLYVDSALNPSTVPGATFVSQNGALVPGTVTVTGGGRVIVFTPAAPFTPNSVVEIAITESATDPSRNPIFAYFGQFLVAADPATLAPTMVQTNPIGASSDNPLNSIIDVEFSEPLNPQTVTNGSSFGVYYFGGGSAIAGTLSLRNGNRTIHFVPADPLVAGAYYYVYLTTAIQDAQGTAFAATNYYFYVGTATDVSTPAAATISPAHASSAVGLNALGVIRFNEPINPITINSTTVTLTAGTAVPFVLSHIDNKTFYVTPQAPLPASTAVTLSVNGAEDTAGHVSPAASSTFTTGLVPDTVRPSIVASNPVYNTANAPVNSVLQLTFDEAMDPGGLTIDVSCLLYDYAVGCIPGGTVSLSADGRVWTYVPPAQLLPNHTYLFGPSASLLDLAGNPLNASGIYFTTSSDPDTDAPQVLAISPPPLSGVPRNAVVEVLFNEPIRATTVDQVDVLVGGNPLPIAARTLSNGNRTLTLTLAGLMAANTVHTISIAGISDIAGNAMATTTSSFTTGSGTDLVSPSSTVTFTPDGTSPVPTTVQPTVRFSEAMDPVRTMSGPTGTGVYLYQPSLGQFVPITINVSADYRTFTIVPASPLQPGTQYQFGVYGWSTDLAGNPYPTSVSVLFVTQ